MGLLQPMRTVETIVRSRATKNKLNSIPSTTRKTAQGGFVSLRAWYSSSGSLLEDVPVTASLEGGVSSEVWIVRGVVGRSWSVSILVGFISLETWLRMRIDGQTAGQETKKEKRRVERGMDRI
jgi:hypothetical protein